MYKVVQTSYGFHITFGGVIKKDEMEKWVEDSRVKLRNSPEKFAVLIDMRTLTPLMPEAQEAMTVGQRLYKDSGMVKSAVILDNAVTTIQFRRLARQSGIYAWERYVDASKTPHWEAVALDWLVHGIDPDK